MADAGFLYVLGGAGFIVAGICFWWLMAVLRQRARD